MMSQEGEISQDVDNDLLIKVSEEFEAAIRRVPLASPHHQAIQRIIEAIEMLDQRIAYNPDLNCSSEVKHLVLQAKVPLMVLATEMARQIMARRQILQAANSSTLG